MKTQLTTLCYIEKDGAYLMLHRTKKKSDINKGKWIGVGGHIEPGESPEECVRREVREETGLILNSLFFRGILHFSGSGEEEEMFLYTSDSFSGTPTECREGELSWVPKEKITELNLWEGDRKFLPLLLKNTRFFSFSLQYDENGTFLPEQEGSFLIQEKGAVISYGEKLKSIGRRALIVTGRHSAKVSGALSDVEKALDENGIHHVLFDEVEENPSTDTIMRAREMGIMGQCDFVIGIGGGSPLDAAKAIALMIRNKDEEKSYLYDQGNKTNALPVVAVPTTCGTGSEATGISVLTRKERRSKGSIPYKIWPVLALVDEKYLCSAGKKLIGNTAVDALAHLLESYLSSKATDYSRAVAMQGLLTWRRIKDVVSGRREAADVDRAYLMTASMLAGIAIGVTGTNLPHALSYTLTMEEDVPHGVAVGYFLSRFMKEAGEEGLFLIRTAGFFDTEELQGFYTAVCKPGSLEREVLLQAVEAVAVNPDKLSAAPFSVDREILLRIAGL